MRTKVILLAGAFAALLSLSLDATAEETRTSPLSATAPEENSIGYKLIARNRLTDGPPRHRAFPALTRVGLDCGYPSAVQLDGGNILVAYYTATRGQPVDSHIELARIHIERAL